MLGRKVKSLLWLLDYNAGKGSKAAALQAASNFLDLQEVAQMADKAAVTAVVKGTDTYQFTSCQLEAYFLAACTDPSYCKVACFYV